MASSPPAISDEQRLKMMRVIARFRSRKSSSARVLLVCKEDPWLKGVLVEVFRQQGFHVQIVADLLDLPPGREVALYLVEMRRCEAGAELPVGLVTERVSSGLMVLGRAISSEERIAALEAGADDVIGVPCNPRELLARARAVLRRTRQPERKH